MKIYYDKWTERAEVRNIIRFMMSVDPNVKIEAIEAWPQQTSTGEASATLSSIPAPVVCRHCGRLLVNGGCPWVLVNGRHD